MGYAFNPFTGNFDNTGTPFTLDIGDSITSASANRLLYTDDSANLANTHWATDNTSYFGGTVTGAYIGAAGFTGPRLEMLNLSGVGQPNAMAFSVNNANGSLFFVDTNTLTSYLGFQFDIATAANRAFTIGLANGIASSPEFKVTTSKVEYNVKIDMNNKKIEELATPTATTDAATKAYVDGIIPDQTGSSGKFLTTNGSAVSWGTVTATPAGSDTQVQFNDSGAFAGDAGLTWNKTSNILTSTSGYRMGSGSANNIGDSDGNGNLYFDGNAAHLYGYSAINFRDGSGQFASFDRARMAHGSQGTNTSPLGGGNLDEGARFGEYITAYAGKGFGMTYSQRVDASANNDIIAGVYAAPNMQVGSYTGVKAYGMLFANLQAATVGMAFVAHASQSANVFEVQNSSLSTIFAVAKNGAIKPASLADSVAENSTIYYSTDASKLVFKDSGGTVNNLY